MPSFTMTLEEVIEMEGEENIGLNEYPIFDEVHRPVLNKKIIDHYYNQEIGQETISMWRLAMKRKMNEIMPLYNENYKLSAIVLEPLITARMKNTTDMQSVSENNGTSTANATADTTGETESKSNAKSQAVASEFPQVALQADADYATNAQNNVSESAADGTSTEHQTNTQTGTEKSDGTQTSTAINLTEGFNGHQPELIFQARQTIMNLDLMIIEELETLFMGIWGTTTEFSQERLPYGWR